MALHQQQREGDALKGVADAEPKGSEGLMFTPCRCCPMVSTPQLTDKLLIRPSPMPCGGRHGSARRRSNANHLVAEPGPEVIPSPFQSDLSWRGKDILLILRRTKTTGAKSDAVPGHSSGQWF